MKKRFNVTGTCIPEKHYMVDISNKLDSILELVNNEEYFIINRPRQYGKTTTLYLLEKRLNTMKEYLPIKISFEAIDTEAYSEVKKFLSSIMMQIVNYFRFSTNKEMYKFTKHHENKIITMNDFNIFITDLIEFSERKVVLIVDEVDKSSNNQLFLDFLGMLRSKYLLRNEGKDYTFHSVILAGVHDIKQASKISDFHMIAYSWEEMSRSFLTKRLKIRPDEEHKYNSPWNIASDFDIDMSFSVEEIKTMLDDYVENKSVDLDKEYYGEKIYFYTSGYPFLVTKLCKIIDEKIMDKNKLKWEKEYLELAVKELLEESNTNFDSLIKNIENNKDLQELIKKIILDGYRVTYNQDNPLITMGIIYGIFKNSKGKIQINNRIYEQRIYNYMVSLVQTKMNVQIYNEKEKYLNKDRTLNVEKVLLSFQEFMKHEYSKKRETFLEEDGRLVFLAFLAPIINGNGFAFKEVKGGEEKRF
uniref:AAA family ATPase n=1 Tax=Clostridium sp. Marseille-Q2269 TaxID=2942205 RepID=UPI0020747511